MTEDMTREKALEALRSALGRVDFAWNAENPSARSAALGQAHEYIASEVFRLEKGADYETPAPAPVDLYFLRPDYDASADPDPEDQYAEMIWEVMGEYDVPVTNNETRWQDGRWLREAGAFTGHIRQATELSGAYYPRKQYELLESIKDDAVNVANAEKQKRIELELELEMWQKGYKTHGSN